MKKPAYLEPEEHAEDWANKVIEAAAFDAVTKAGHDWHEGAYDFYLDFMQGLPDEVNNEAEAQNLYELAYERGEKLVEDRLTDHSPRSFLSRDELYPY